MIYMMLTSLTILPHPQTVHLAILTRLWIMEPKVVRPYLHQLSGLLILLTILPLED